MISEEYASLINVFKIFSSKLIVVHLVAVIYINIYEGCSKKHEHHQNFRVCRTHLTFVPASPSQKLSQT